MEFNINEVKVSIDHITATSDDRRRIQFEANTIKGYRYLGMKPTKETNETKSYRIFHEYLHTETLNKVHVLTDRISEAYYLPNLTIKFFPAWENKLKYEEIIRVLNAITVRYNIPFNLSQYHVAIDLFSKDNYLDRLVAWIKSGRKYDPEEHPDYHGTYYFHSERSQFYLVAYDKRKQSLEKGEFSENARRELDNCNVTRIEARFNDASEIPSLQELATHCFEDLIPRRIEFLMPDDIKLRRHGIRPSHYQDIGLKGLRGLLEAKGVEHNLPYYTKENIQLSTIVKAALQKYRWCATSCDHPILQPKIIIRPQKIKFTKQQ